MYVRQMEIGNLTLCLILAACITSGSCAALSASSSASAPRANQPATDKDTQGNSVQFAIGDAAFADRVVAFEEGTPATTHPGYRNPATALGPPKGDHDNEVVTLGCGGRLTLEFTDNVLVDQPGPDLHIFEVGPQVESMEIEISVDGRTWIDLGAVKGQPASVDIHDKAQPGAEYRFVRITDLKSACGSDYPGADIDAVGTISGKAK
jgi:OmpA-OmpF porin, OOP family